MRGTIRTGIVAVIAVAVGWVAGAADPKQENSPHADALAMLLSKQADEIRKIEIASRGDDEVNKANTFDDAWWHDVKERTWIVQRTIYPGSLDSTHWFEVTYRIDGKDVAKWMVDTRDGTAKLDTIKKK